MPDRLYNVAHEINSNNYQVYSPQIEYSVFYPNNNKSFKDIVNDQSFIFKNIYNNIDITILLGNYILNNIFSIFKNINKLELELSLPSNVLLESVNDQFITINKNENRILTIVSASLVDNVGNSAPLPTLSIERDVDVWRISINIDETWINDSSRVFPLLYTLSTSFSALPSMASMNIRALSSDSGQVYQDTRPDSAVQFYVAFYDDSEFRRPKAIYQGLPVCSTVPYAVGDTYDLTPADIQQWYDGIGDENRNVYLQIILSKSLDTNQNITYDVILPGVVDYLNQQAEFVDMMSDLPIYRGVFPINKNNSPSYVDGLGYLNIYLTEIRYKALSSRVNILRIGKDDLTANLLLAPSSTKDGIKLLNAEFEVLPTPLLYAFNNLDGDMIVYQPPPSISMQTLSGKINIVPKLYYGINPLTAEIDVHELGRYPLSGNVIILPKSSLISYGIGTLTASANITGSPYTFDAWYNANNWNYYGIKTIKQQMKFDTISNYPVDFVKVSSHDPHGVALDVNGHVWEWGEYSVVNGQYHFPLPEKLDDIYIFTDIAATVAPTIALNSSGEIWGWGYDIYGILGPPPTSYLNPTKISGASIYKKISSNAYSVAVIDSTDHVYWRGNVLCNGVLVTSFTICSDLAARTFDDVCCGDKFILALTALGEVYKVGQFLSEGVSSGVKISGAHVFTKIIAGAFYAIGLKADGTVWGWGYNGNKQMGYLFADNYTNSPVQITEVPEFVNDISCSCINNYFFAYYLCTNNIYSFGEGYGIGNKHNGILTDADATREYRSASDLIEKVRPLNNWDIISESSIIDNSYKIYTNFPNFQKVVGTLDIGSHNNLSHLVQLRMMEQDEWGGNNETYFTNGLNTYYLPKLSTYLTRNIISSFPSVFKNDGASRFSMDATELSNSSTSYVVAKMNAQTTGSQTNWDLYKTLILINPDHVEDYTNFPYLYMMMNADSTRYSPFKQRSYYPYDKVNRGYINYPFAQDKALDFYIYISYIYNVLSTPLTPFDSSYSLKYLDWSDDYLAVNSKIGVEVTLYDENIGYSSCNIKTQDINKYTNSMMFSFSINDFTPKPTAAYSWNDSGNTYPVKVKLLIQPDMYLYNQNNTNYNFISPQSWIEITNIIINPY